MSEGLATGRVLGIDVGFAATRGTTCFCALEWTNSVAQFRFALATRDVAARRLALCELGLMEQVQAVAVDGPLTRGLQYVTHYRAAEAILSQGVLQKRGKPGQTSSPVGQQLHTHATQLAILSLDSMAIASSSHWEPIHPKCVVEAFPNMYLAALIPEGDMPVLARDASDRYWEILVDESDRLKALIGHLLPGRQIATDLKSVRNHEHRAGVVCALTALSVAVGDYVSVGDAEDGDIFLPPQAAWGLGAQDAGTWLEPVLRSNLQRVTARRAHPNHRYARIATNAGCWGESVMAAQHAAAPEGCITRGSAGGCAAGRSAGTKPSTSEAMK
jgi:predicted nuclease with RNAse H fold